MAIAMFVSCGNLIASIDIEWGSIYCFDGYACSKIYIHLLAIIASLPAETLKKVASIVGYIV